MSTHDPAGPGHNPARCQALSCLAAWTGAAVIWDSNVSPTTRA
jgi:hypothetical protein